MEKLIELLNKFIKVEKNYHRAFEDENDVSKYDCLIIFKNFGFIEWLVQNNRIDKRKIDTRLVRYVESHYDEEGYWVENSYEDYSDTNTLIMLLSISKTPIEDLIDYLK